MQVNVVSGSSTLLFCNVNGASEFSWSRNELELLNVKESSAAIYIPIVTQPGIFNCEADDKMITFVLSVTREFFCFGRVRCYSSDFLERFSMTLVGFFFITCEQCTLVPCTGMSFSDTGHY